jgi:arginyl-tRNA synthetase
MSALRYFILKVDPKKKMLFNPQESIDFNGHTGPFVQYTHARICSILRNYNQNVDDSLIQNCSYSPSNKEASVLRTLAEFPEKIEEAAHTMNPGIIANYVYEVAKEYNQFYHDFQVLKEEDLDARNFRLVMSKAVAQVIKNSLELLCIEAPERM